MARHPATHLGDVDYHGPAPTVSIVILTHNEARNLPACLRSCAWCDDVHVVDSGSSDDTRAIAASLGARVHEHPFASFGEQRNWAIDHAGARHPWQLHLDADERLTPELVREIADRLTSDATLDQPPAAYRVAGQMVFMDCWLRYSAGYPTWQVRLIDTRRCRFTDYGHGQRELTDGPVATLESPYVHFNFSHGLDAWLARHNRYSRREAEQGVTVLAGDPLRWRDLLARDPVLRRRAVKALSYRMPGRAWARFMHSYLLRGGWRDGAAGWRYARMLAVYEHWTQLKMAQRQGDWPGRNREMVERFMREAGR